MIKLDISNLLSIPNLLFRPFNSLLRFTSNSSIFSLINTLTIFGFHNKLLVLLLAISILLILLKQVFLINFLEDSSKFSIIIISAELFLEQD